MTENDLFLLKMRIRIFIKSNIAQIIGILGIVAIFFFYGYEISEGAEDLFEKTRVEREKKSEELQVTVLPVIPCKENPPSKSLKPSKKK